MTTQPKLQRFDWTTTGMKHSDTGAFVLASDARPAAALGGASGVPAGWKLVPVEPTPEMVEAGENAHARCDDAEIYRAMLAVAPAAPPEAQQEPLAWHVEWPGEGEKTWVQVFANERDAIDAAKRHGGLVIPCVRQSTAPQPSAVQGEREAFDYVLRTQAEFIVTRLRMNSPSIYQDAADIIERLLSARAALTPQQPEASPAEQAGEARYIVIGYGESDKPMAALVPTQDGLLDAVLGMIYTHPSDADEETRESYRRDLDDEDEWHEGIWRTEFEIGGIVVYDVGATLASTEPAGAGKPTDAARDVLAERQRQVSVEGWTPEHDDEHTGDQLSMAAACYALANVAPYTGYGIDVKRTWSDTGWSWSWWKPRSRRENLVRSGALIIAEIERLDRLAARANDTETKS
jgi:hypothetical protein